MDRLDVLLHVLLDLRVLVIIQAAVIELLLLLRHLENHVLRALLLLFGPFFLLLVLLEREALIHRLINTPVISLTSLGLEQLLLVTINIKDINDAICATHEVRMVSIDVRVLHLNQTSHHLRR